MKFLIQNPRLKFAVETLLKAANPAGEPYFKATHFHKMMYLLYERLKKKQIDITKTYDNWLKIGFAFAEQFSESGRELFIRISKLYTDFSFYNQPSRLRTGNRKDTTNRLWPIVC